MGQVEEGVGGELEVLAGRFADFARTAAARLPLYRRLAEGAAGDPDVARLLLAARADQRVPTLLLAAVHDVLLAGADDPLRAWYRSVVDDPRAVGFGAEDPWPHFRRLALEDADVLERVRTAATQTNEVGRCAVLLPALAQVAAEAPGAPPGGARPLGLVEVGASAGLNLLLDRYGYRYEPTSARPLDAAVELAPDAPLVLRCALRGEGRPPIPTTFPHLASRVGIDLDPVDLADRRQARWLVACQWPEHHERVHQARTAIALAHGAVGREGVAHVVAGDAVDDLAVHVEAVPQHALPVVVATWALAYLAPERQRAFVVELDRLATARELTLLFAEHPERVPGLPVPARADGVEDDRPTALVRVDWRHAEGNQVQRRAVRLADVHPHGSWMAWLEG